MENTNRKNFYPLIIFSLALLFNSNINLVDILPDFIAYFILAKLFERAADSAAYFEEARVAFARLGWLNFAKIPALILIVLIRGGNAADNDVFALFSFSFAVIEALLAINAAKNIFAALFHLGERTPLSSAITPFAAPVCKKRSLTPQAMKEYTYFFIICKSIIYWLPDMFLLTKVTDSGHIVTISKYYPYVLILAQILGTIVGVIWLVRIIKYVKVIHLEGEFENSLSLLANEDTSIRFQTKTKIRSINSILTFMIVTSFFSLELIFDDFDRINILPHFLFGILMICVFHMLGKHSYTDKRILISGAAYSLLAALAYSASVYFYTTFDYKDLMDIAAAKNAYTFIIVFSVLEFMALLTFLLFCSKIYKSFILKNTGLDTESEKYNTRDAELHKTLIKHSYIHCALAALVGLTQLLNVIFKRFVRLVFTDITDVTMPTVYTSLVPWFNLVVTAASVAYILYTFYLVSTLKEEVSMRYQ